MREHGAGDMEGWIAELERYAWCLATALLEQHRLYRTATCQGCGLRYPCPPAKLADEVLFGVLVDHRRIPEVPQPAGR